MIDFEFTTQRLRVRRWKDSDLEPLLAVYGDAEVMRWVGDGRPLALEQATRWFEVTRSNYDRRGYGMFAVEQRAMHGPRRAARERGREQKPAVSLAAYHLAQGQPRMDNPGNKP